MNAHFDGGGDSGNVFIGVPYSRGTNPDIINLRGVGWSPLSGQVQIRQNPDSCERNINVQRNSTSSTDLERRMPVMPRGDLEQDTFLDNEIGTAVRSAKAKFGEVPFIAAYKRVLSASKKLDGEWEEYWEEEANMISFFKEGDD